MTRRFSVHPEGGSRSERLFRLTIPLAMGMGLRPFVRFPRFAMISATTRLLLRKIQVLEPR
jgi:hypothetical protein